MKKSLRPAVWRSVVDRLVETYRVSERRACRALGSLDFMADNPALVPQP